MLQLLHFPVNLVTRMVRVMDTIHELAAALAPDITTLHAGHHLLGLPLAPA